MISVLLFLLGLIYANLMEWILHKYILHRMGKNKYSMFHFHIEHHSVCTFNSMADSPSVYEAFYLFLLSLIHVWLLYFSTWLFLGALSGCILYWGIHTKAHLDVDWMIKWIPWHYTHHSMYTNANWCVTYPLWDIIFRTYRGD